jgi:hypothetical protein
MTISNGNNPGPNGWGSQQSPSGRVSSPASLGPFRFYSIFFTPKQTDQSHQRTTQNNDPWSASSSPNNQSEQHYSDNRAPPVYRTNNHYQHAQTLSEPRGYVPISGNQQYGDLHQTPGSNTYINQLQQLSSYNTGATHPAYPTNYDYAQSQQYESPDLYRYQPNVVQNSYPEHYPAASLASSNGQPAQVRILVIRCHND